MNPAFRSMLWKEWRERRTLFFICLAWMVAIAIYSIVYEASHRFHAPIANFYATTAFFGIFTPIFVAMRVSLGEATDRTRAVSDSLPCSSHTRAWLRLGGGAAAFLIPIALGAAIVGIALAAGWVEQGALRGPISVINQSRLPLRETLSRMDALQMLALVATVSALCASGLYLLVAVCGTALRTESHAGFAGAGIGAAWMLTMAVSPLLDEAGMREFVVFVGALDPQALITNYSFGELNGSYGDLGTYPHSATALAINAAFQAILALWFVRRYARIPQFRRRERAYGVVNRSGGGSIRAFKNGGAALAWLSLRQALPMCAPGLVLACLMAALEATERAFDGKPYLSAAVNGFPHTAWGVGLFWAAIVGASLFASETDSRVSEFLKSRPIRIRRLFLVKLAIGLFSVLAVLDGSAILTTWWSPEWGSNTSMNWPFLTCLVPMHATLFMVAVACACALRRPVIGGMLSLGICYSGVVAGALIGISLDPTDVYNGFAYRHYSGVTAGLNEILASSAYHTIAIAMGITCVVSAFVAQWSLMRFKPGVRSA